MSGESDCRRGTDGRSSRPSRGPLKAHRPRLGPRRGEARAARGWWSCSAARGRVRRETEPGGGCEVRAAGPRRSSVVGLALGTESGGGCRASVVHVRWDSRRGADRRGPRGGRWAARGPWDGREGRPTVLRRGPALRDMSCSGAEGGRAASHGWAVHRGGDGGACVSDGRSWATKSTATGQRRARTPIPAPLARRIRQLAKRPLELAAVRARCGPTIRGARRSRCACCRGP